MQRRATAKASSVHTGRPFFDAQSTQSRAFFPRSPVSVAPQAQPDGADKTETEPKESLAQEPVVQTKLVIGAPGDRFEREADVMADRVVQGLHTGGACGGAIPPLQTKCSECREEDKLQRQTDSGATFDGLLQAKADGSLEVPGSVHHSLEGGRSGGESLHPTLRDDMEHSFEVDFAGVRIHTGGAAEQHTRALSARAFTYGTDIYFNSGEYQPETSRGRHLLAHELAHVVQQTSPAIQRQPTVPSADPTVACTTAGQPGAGSAQYDDHAMGPSGTYYIYGTSYKGESAGAYTAAAIDAWIGWRFGNLSTAVANRIRTETARWGWEWVPKSPNKGCQALLRMSINDVGRLVRIAGYDIQARPAVKKEKAAGLPDLPEPSGFGVDLVIVGAKPGGSAPLSGAPKDKRKEAEEALDPTSVYNKGRIGATDPAFPISMDGPEMEVPHGLGTYTARIHYEEVTNEPVMLLAYGMNSVSYYWELFNITNVLMRGMSMGNSMLEEAKRTQQVAQDLPTNPQAARAADGASRQRAINAVDQLSDESRDSLRELRNPIKAAAGGSAIDVVSRAYANFLNLELLPVSAIVAAGGWLVSELGSLLGGYSKEKEIAFPESEGYYMVRCIAQPGPRGPEHSERRAASVRAKIVEVRRPELLAKNALGLADAAIAQLQLQKVMTSDPAELARLDKQIANVQEQTSGDIVAYLTRLIVEREKDKRNLPAWRQSAAQRELDALNLRLTQAKDKRDGTGSVHIRPQVAFTSTITGETYPLMIELSPILVVDSDGIEVANRKKVRLFDATVPDREKIDREGTTIEEAVANVFEIFRKSGVLGPGMLFVRMPAGWAGTREFSLRVSASGGAVVKKRLEDLAMALLVLSMVVPGVGEISMVIAASLAAERLISRALNHSLRLDAEVVSDTLAILGAVAQGAALIGKLRIAKSGDAFIGALRSTEQNVLDKAAAELAAAIKVGNALNATSTVVNVGGMIWGDLVMINRFAEIQAAEMNGAITHSEAARQRASMLSNAIVMHGVMLHGMLKPQGADRAGGEPGKLDARPHEDIVPKREGPPETIPETELEQRASAPAKAAPEGQPSPERSNVRTRFRTPDNLHDIFILEDGRIFRCSLLCSQMRDWYDPYLTRQPEGSRRERASELSGQLQLLEARAKAGEKSPELDHTIGLLDVAMREFIAPDLARDLQQSFQGRPGVKPGETYLNEGQVRGLLKFFNLDEIVRFTSPDWLPSAKAVRDLADLLGAVDKFLTPADRGALRPLLSKIVDGGQGAANAIDFLNRVARIHDVRGVKVDLADLRAAFERGDAVLDHGPLQPKKFLETEYGPYELEGGRLKFGGAEGNMPKGLLRPPVNGAIDFVLIENGGTTQLVLGWEHTGLSGGRASVFGAGRLIVNKAGFVVRIDRMSGHYRPSEANLQRAVKFLIDKGILLEPAVARSMGRPVFEVNPAF